MSFNVDRDICTGCGTCTSDCVLGLLAMTEGVPVFKDGTGANCVHCGHCASVCPAHAFLLDGLNPDLLQSVDKSAALEGHLDAFLKCRRSIRQYAGGSVDQALLERALEYANYAPTAHNYRQVSYIVINGRIKVEDILHKTMRHLEKHDMYPGQVANIKDGRDTLFRGAPCLILIHAPERVLSETDCATAASYLEVALHALGLGSCWAGMLIESCVHSLPEGIDIPEGHRLYGALMVGKPGISYKSIPFRTAPEVVWT